MTYSAAGAKYLYSLVTATKVCAAAPCCLGTGLHAIPVIFQALKSVSKFLNEPQG